MSVPFRSPTIIAGTPYSSGDIQTGEIAWTRGGGRGASVHSGAIAMTVLGVAGAFGSGGSVLLWSGAGRLNSFTALWPAGVALAGNGAAGILSGMPIVAYDSAITARSGVFTDGTIAESGRATLYTWYAPQVLSGVNVNSPGYVPVAVDKPFNSGLCVMALSGSPAFTVTFTPERNSIFP